jgi:hypothetical protein
MGCISYIADVVGLVVPSCLLDRKVKQVPLVQRFPQLTSWIRQDNVRRSELAARPKAREERRGLPG